MTEKPTSKSATGLPSPQQILEFIEGSDRKVGKREIARAFGIRGAGRTDLKRMLRNMADEGLIEGPRKRLRRPGDLPAVNVLIVEGIDNEGDLIGVPVEWNEEDGPAPRIIVRETKGRGRRSHPAPGIGDRVLARLQRDDALGAYAARIIKVLKRKPRTALGVLRRVGDQYRVVPIARKGTEFSVAQDSASGAADGDLVRVEPLPSKRYGPPRGKIVERMGSVASEKAASLIAIAEHDIPYVFPTEVLAETEDLPSIDVAGREDWRDLPFVTIDPIDARDHDDAVLALPGKRGQFDIRIAIADVAGYVRPGSAIDREARKRGNSVYFPGRVVPMLPELISNDKCSLVEGEDRPALAARIIIDAAGRAISHSFHRVMIRSAATLTYAQAQDAVDGRPDESTGSLLDSVLKPLWDAYERLRTVRDERAPLDLNVPERKVVLNEAGAVDRIVIPPRLDAHRLIEEFMILANVCAAETLEQRKAPAVYRIHDEPTWDKLDALRDFLKSLDLSLPKSGNLRPAQFNRILENVSDTRHEAIVNEVVLRSQSQAEYSTHNIGHFGLNLHRYAHFTSPIRRYADLLVHRALISSLSLGPGGIGQSDPIELEQICGEISMTERRAMAAERDTVDRLVASWLSDKVGARFTGRIRGVTRAGLFVELDDIGADGFVPIGSIDEDYYSYEEARHRIFGRSTGRIFQLGEPVEVRLAESLPFAGSLRFEILEGGHFEKPSTKIQSKRRKARSRKRGTRKGR